MLETPDMRSLQKLLRRVFAAVNKERASKEEEVREKEEQRQASATDCTPNRTARGPASGHPDGDAAPVQDSVEKKEAPIVSDRMQSTEPSMGKPSDRKSSKDQSYILKYDAEEDSGNDSDEDLVQRVQEIRLELESKQKDRSRMFISRGPGNSSQGHGLQRPGAQMHPRAEFSYGSQHVIGFQSASAAIYPLPNTDTTGHNPINHGLSDVQDVAEEVLDEFLRKNPVGDELQTVTEDDWEALGLSEYGDSLDDMLVPGQATLAPPRTRNAPATLAGPVTHLGNQRTANTNVFEWSSTPTRAFHTQPAQLIATPSLVVPSQQIGNTPRTGPLLPHSSATTQMASNALWPATGVAEVPSTASSAASRLLPAPTASSAPSAPSPTRARPEEQQYHQQMLDRIKCMKRGRRRSKAWETFSYNIPKGETDLITFLKEAVSTGKPKFDKIYGAARCYLLEKGGHIVLMYDKDSHGFTALYYAARLGRDHPMIAGFIAECLVEAEERCSLIPNGRKYKVTEERYSHGDNIFHCLARWHSATNHLVFTASVLRQVAHRRLESLLFTANDEGKLPYELCRPDSDMRLFLAEPRYTSHGH